MLLPRHHRHHHHLPSLFCRHRIHLLFLLLLLLFLLLLFFPLLPRPVQCLILLLVKSINVPLYTLLHHHQLHIFSLVTLRLLCWHHRPPPHLSPHRHHHYLLFLLWFTPLRFLLCIQLHSVQTTQQRFLLYQFRVKALLPLVKNQHVFHGDCRPMLVLFCFLSSRLVRHFFKSCSLPGISSILFLHAIRQPMA